MIELALNFSIFLRPLSKFNSSNTTASFFVLPLPTLRFWEPWKDLIWIGLTFIITVTNDSPLFNPFQSSVVFHTETVIQFTLQIMPDFYMQCYTGLEWVKRECWLRQILNLSLPNCFWGSFVKKTQNSSESSKPFWWLRFGKGSPAHPSSNREGLRDIQNSMSMVLDTRFHTWFIMTVYYKMRRLIQIATVQWFKQSTSIYFVFVLPNISLWKNTYLSIHFSFMYNCTFS